MALVPAFLAIDGVKFPLAIEGEYVQLRNDTRFPGLSALSYVVAHLIDLRQGSAGVPALNERRDVVRPQALAAVPVAPADVSDLGPPIANWTRLSGAPPDLGDAYSIGTTFLEHGLVMPRSTLIALVEQIGALRDAVAAKQLEAKLDGTPEAGPVNPPPEATEDDEEDGGEADEDSQDSDQGDDETAASTAIATPATPTPAVTPASAPAAPTRIAGDDTLRDIDRVAAQVDELDAAARQGPAPYASVERNAAAAAKRHRLMIELDVAGLLAPALADQARAALTRLGLPRLVGYIDAAAAMAGYLASPERARMFKHQPPPALLESRVALDWFRAPSGYQPEGVSERDWLALCERNFAGVTRGQGSLFVRLEGAMHALRYRPELGPAPCLWRAERG